MGKEAEIRPKAPHVNSGRKRTESQTASTTLIKSEQKLKNETTTNWHHATENQVPFIGIPSGKAVALNGKQTQQGNSPNPPQYLPSTCHPLLRGFPKTKPTNSVLKNSGLRLQRTFVCLSDKSYVSWTDIHVRKCKDRMWESVRISRLFRDFECFLLAPRAAFRYGIGTAALCHGLFSKKRQPNRYLCHRTGSFLVSNSWCIAGNCY